MPIGLLLSKVCTYLNVRFCLTSATRYAVAGIMMPFWPLAAQWETLEERLY